MMQKRSLFSLIVLMVAVVAFGCTSNGMANDLSPPLSQMDNVSCDAVFNAFTATEKNPATTANVDSSVYPTTATVNNAINPAITSQPALNTVIEENIANPFNFDVWGMVSGLYFSNPPIVNQAHSQTLAPPINQGNQEVAHSTEIASDYDVTLQEANANKTPANASSPTNSIGVEDFPSTAVPTGTVAMVLLKNSGNIDADYPNPYYGIYNVSGMQQESQALTSRIDKEADNSIPFNKTPNGSMENATVSGCWTQTPEVVLLMMIPGDADIFCLTDGRMVTAIRWTKTTGSDYPNPISA